MPLNEAEPLAGWPAVAFVIAAETAGVSTRTARRYRSQLAVASGHPTE